jgi:hypothetical protein
LVGIIRSIIGKWLPIKHHGSCLPTCETCEVCLEVVTQQLQSVLGAAFLIGCYRALHNKKYGTIYIYITIYNHQEGELHSHILYYIILYYIILH